MCAVDGYLVDVDRWRQLRGCDAPFWVRFGSAALDFVRRSKTNHTRGARTRARFLVVQKEHVLFYLPHPLVRFKRLYNLSRLPTIHERTEESKEKRVRENGGNISVQKEGVAIFQFHQLSVYHHQQNKPKPPQQYFNYSM
jgi:hypothetical protein